MTIQQAAELSLAEIAVENSPHSQHTYQWHYRTICEDWGAERQLATITRHEVQQWLNEYRSRFKPATLRHKLSALTRLFRVASENSGEHYEAPTRDIRKPRVNNKRERILMDDEQAELRFHLKPRDYSIIEFALQTGLRRIEQWRLRPQDIRLYFEEQPAGEPVLIGMANIITSKTGIGRQVPLNPLAAQIARYWREQGGAYLFPDNSKNRLHAASRWTSEHFRRALRDVGIEGMTWHDLRHTFATRSLQGGARPEQISRMLGHTNLTMTSRYLHWAPEQLWPAAMAGLNRSRQRTESRGQSHVGKPDRAPELPAPSIWALPTRRFAGANA